MNNMGLIVKDCWVGFDESHNHDNGRPSLEYEVLVGMLTFFPEEIRISEEELMHKIRTKNADDFLNQMEVVREDEEQPTYGNRRNFRHIVVPKLEIGHEEPDKVPIDSKTLPFNLLKLMCFSYVLDAFSKTYVEQGVFLNYKGILIDGTHYNKGMIDNDLRLRRPVEQIEFGSELDQRCPLVHQADELAYSLKEYYRTKKDFRRCTKYASWKVEIGKIERAIRVHEK